MRLEYVLYYIGIAIVFLTHIAMLIKPTMFMRSVKEIRAHAILNLLGASFIAYYFMKTNGYLGGASKY